jgi:DNA repair protein RadC
MQVLCDKMASRGVGALSDKELLALLVDDVQVADALWDACGGALARIAACG